MLKIFGDNDKITYQEMLRHIESLRNYEIKTLEDDIKNLTQLVSMLISELGYGATMRRGEVVTLTKHKKK